jgi:hypothetical protein
MTFVIRNWGFMAAGVLVTDHYGSANSPAARLPSQWRNAIKPIENSGLARASSEGVMFLNGSGFGICPRFWRRAGMCLVDLVRFELNDLFHAI